MASRARRAELFLVGVLLGSRHLLRCLREATLANHGDLDFAGIRELLLKGVGDLAANLRGRFVGGRFRAGDHANLAAGLNRERLFYTLETSGDRFELLHPFDVAVERFTPGPRPRRTTSIGRS